jgi:hypothetical protein
MARPIESLKRELENWPKVSYAIEHGKAHPKLRLEYEGNRRFVPFSTTKVDPRGMMNKITELRRTLRDIGAQRGN